MKMERWDKQEKSIDEEITKEIIEDFESAKQGVICYRYKKEKFLIGLDLISEGKRNDEELDFYELKLEKICRENYKMLKSKGKDVDEIMNFFSEKTKDSFK